MPGIVNSQNEIFLKLLGLNYGQFIFQKKLSHNKLSILSEMPILRCFGGNKIIHLKHFIIRINNLNVLLPIILILIKFITQLNFT